MKKKTKKRLANRKKIEHAKKYPYLSHLDEDTLKMLDGAGKIVGLLTKVESPLVILE